MRYGKESKERRKIEKNRERRQVGKKEENERGGSLVLRVLQVFYKILTY